MMGKGWYWDFSFCFDKLADDYTIIFHANTELHMWRKYNAFHLSNEAIPIVFLFNEFLAFTHLLILVQYPSESTLERRPVLAQSSFQTVSVILIEGIRENIPEELPAQFLRGTYCQLCYDVSRAFWLVELSLLERCNEGSSLSFRHDTLALIANFFLHACIGAAGVHGHRCYIGLLRGNVLCERIHRGLGRAVRAPGDICMLCSS